VQPGTDLYPLPGDDAIGHSMSPTRRAAEDFVSIGLAMAGREYLEPFREASVDQMRDVTPAQLMEGSAAFLSARDRAALSGPLGEYLAASSSVSFAQGVVGWVDDELAFVAPFEFEIGDIRIPALIVHGVQDRFLPVAHGRWLAGAVSDGEAWILGEDGHLSLVDRIPAVH
jgi:pimeloyl-ACP methyl ester carboxylesterase